MALLRFRAERAVLRRLFGGPGRGADARRVPRGGDSLRDEGDAARGSQSRTTRPTHHHHGGQLQFGPDGYLYLSTGDGDSSAINAQELTNPLGKILRIDPRQAGAAPYTVPAGNPFVGVAGMDEIWSYGLRNPWRFSFDRENGALAIGDVGRARFEEVD